jgi:four helix bundle protein
MRLDAPTRMATYDPDALLQRAHRFAVWVTRFCRGLPQTAEGRDFGGQLRRAGTAVSANYRAARRGRSHAAFTAKLAVVAEEADEAVHWLELIRDSGTPAPPDLADLLGEAYEIRGIFGKAYGTAKRNRDTGHKP